jgi:hypothetical protein
LEPLTARLCLNTYGRSKKIEDLGALIKRTTASKEDIKELRSEMKAGFDRIEHLLLPKQEQRLTDLGTRMKKLEDTLAV